MVLIMNEYYKDYTEDYNLIYKENPELTDSKIIVNNSFIDSESYNKNNLHIFRDVFTDSHLKDILDYFIKFKKYPVNLTGIADVDNQVIGSYRASVYNTQLAKFLSFKLNQKFKDDWVASHFTIENKKLNKYSFVNHNKQKNNIESEYELLGVSPLFRYMEYSSGSEGHVPHYDAPYEYSDDTLSLMTGILYFSTSDTASTYFLPKEAQQIDTPMLDRNTEDWKEHYPDLVQCTHVLPEKGKILLFDHQLAHGVSPFTSSNPNDKRIIIRFDLIYKRVS